jgi:hypothetical protein
LRGLALRGLHHREDACPDHSGQRVPSGIDGGEIGIDRGDRRGQRARKCARLPTGLRFSREIVGAFES